MCTVTTVHGGQQLFTVIGFFVHFVSNLFITVTCFGNNLVGDVFKKLTRITCHCHLQEKIYWKFTKYSIVHIGKQSPLIPLRFLKLLHLVQMKSRQSYLR